MSRPASLDRELADTFSKYVRAVDGVERQQLGARLDVLAAQVLTKEQLNAQQPADRVAA